MNSLLFSLQWLRPVLRRGDGDDVAFLVEGQAVDAHLAVDAGREASVDEILVDAVVDDVPFVATWNLENAVMRRAENVVLGLLLDDHVVLLIDGDGIEGRFSRTVADVVVG